MSAVPPHNSNPSGRTPDLSDEEVLKLLTLLRRKEGRWVNWGEACQTLQRAGYDPQHIFEETGFEPIQQNQIIVAFQVYQAIAKSDISEDLRSHYELRGSDVLYEFRVLAQQERAAAAALAFTKNIDADEAHDIAKAIKAYSWLATPPENFAPFDEHPGDAIAYHYWKLARQQSDLQARSRLIAQGLRFAESASARKAVEALLTDFTVTRSRPIPLLPIYRVDSEENLPRIVPVAGQLPLDADSFKAVPLVEDEGPFRLVKFSGTGAWVPIPGWQVVLLAEDPVVVLAHTDHLPSQASQSSEDVLVLIDRSQRSWNADSYFLADVDGQLKIQWTEEQPSTPLLGRVIVVLKPKRFFDEELSLDPWQIEE